jgi:hypothetical protein
LDAFIKKTLLFLIKVIGNLQFVARPFLQWALSAFDYNAYSKPAGRLTLDSAIAFS